MKYQQKRLPNLLKCNNLDHHLRFSHLDFLQLFVTLEHHITCLYSSILVTTNKPDFIYNLPFSFSL